jgi:adenylate cyclase
VSGLQIKERLAAVLAADAAGYSRLMAADGRATLAALDSARAIFRTQIEANQGRVIDMAGDSVLAVFETANGAVSAAIAAQAEINTSASAMPEDRQMRFRIGVHLGDLIEKADGTVYGDGVNIASRLQALAEVGGITASDSVRSAVRGKVTADFDDQGELQVKNIAHPVRAFAVRAEGTVAKLPSDPVLPIAGQVASTPARFTHLKLAVAGFIGMAVILAAGDWYWRSSRIDEGKPEPALADSKSIAVLPFVNMSDNKENAYFADGMQEELLTHLALLGELKVVSRTSAMEYRDTKKNTRQIGSELGVRNLVEGSVRRDGDVVRVTVQLIDAGSDKHLWAHIYERNLKDVFAIQNDLATEIAQALKVSLSPHEQAQLTRKPTDNPAAYDIFLRYQDTRNNAKGTFRQVSAEAFNGRIAMLEKAVELDPQFALAWAKLGTEHAYMYQRRVDRSESRLDKAQQAIQRAVALAPDDIAVLIEQGKFYQYRNSEIERAAQTFEKVLRVAPNNVDARLGLAAVRLKQGQVADYATQMEAILAVDPRNLDALVSYTVTLDRYRQFDRSLALRRKMIDIRPEDVELQTWYWAAELQKTRQWDAYDKWRKSLPPAIASKSQSVYGLDRWRAWAHRDFDEVMRLANSPPEQFLDVGLDHLFLQYQRVDAHLAKGDRPRANAIARNVLEEVKKFALDSPDDWFLWSYSALAHATLGERAVALADQDRARKAAVAEMGYYDGMMSSEENLLSLYAQLGNRELALQELRRQIRLPIPDPELIYFDGDLVSLWDDPQYAALVNDPANRAPLPLENAPLPAGAK